MESKYKEILSVLKKYHQLCEISACVLNLDILTCDNTFRHCTGGNLSDYDSDDFINNMKNTYLFLNESDQHYLEILNIIKNIINYEKLLLVILVWMLSQIMTSLEKQRVVN